VGWCSLLVWRRRVRIAIRRCCGAEEEWLAPLHVLLRKVDGRGEMVRLIDGFSRNRKTKRYLE